jgi:hypothetical protein
MPNLPHLLRQRVASEAVTGANQRIQQGLFGSGSPEPDVVEFDPSKTTGIYAYHEGDRFSPGAQNWVFEPNFELPTVTIWGNAFLRTPNTFSPLQPVQLYSYQNITTDGIGGLEAGYLELQPLLDDQGVSGGFNS